MRTAAFLLLPLLAGCATISGRPFAPDASIDFLGSWRVVSLSGERVHGSGYRAEFKPDYAVIQTGCNAGSGPYRSANGWFTKSGDWIFTVAGCPGERERQQRKGERITSVPLAVEARSGGFRLRGTKGWLDLAR